MNEVKETSLVGSKRVIGAVLSLVVFTLAKYGIIIDDATQAQIQANIDSVIVVGLSIWTILTKILDEWKTKRQEAHWSFWDLFNVFKILRKLK